MSESTLLHNLYTDEYQTELTLYAFPYHVGEKIVYIDPIRNERRRAELVAINNQNNTATLDNGEIVDLVTIE